MLALQQLSQAGWQKEPPTQSQLADDFEKEMNEELTQRMDDMSSQASSAATEAKVKEQPAASNQFYDDEYFDSDDEDDGFD